MPMEYIVPNLRIVAITAINNVGVVNKILSQLLQLEEERFVIGYHQNIEKVRKNSWHDRKIKNKKFLVRELVLLYGNKFLKHPGKIRTHWLVPYIVIQLTEGGAMHLQKLDGTPFKGLVNGSRLKPYRDRHTSVD